MGYYHCLLNKSCRKLIKYNYCYLSTWTYLHVIFYVILRRRDKSQQATVEQVLDPRTRMILYRLLSKGTLLEINGAISTGKEANVYHATAKDGTDKAIKVSIYQCFSLQYRV